jgi:hypothetical protein
MAGLCGLVTRQQAMKQSFEQCVGLLSIDPGEAAATDIYATQVVEFARLHHEVVANVA